MKIGIIGAGNIGGTLARKLAASGHEVKLANSKEPFGVNLTFLPSFTAPPYPEYIAAMKEAGIKAVETPCRSPEQYMPALKAAGIKVIHKCTSLRHSLKAEKIGCDAVSVDGFECGGHPGEDDIPNMILLPRAADDLKIPFVASGGMANASSLVAALKELIDRIMTEAEQIIRQRLTGFLGAVANATPRAVA
jgi:NAD(P)H-dependent flavin oxidoreductase YrpB (nitropropane dioxygenase family)